MKSSRSDILRQAITLLAIVAAFAINVLSNLFPVNGENVGEIANTVFRDVQIIPANYAFAIWGLIYLGLFAFGIYQALPSQRQNPRLRRLGYWLVIASFAQMVWIFLFQSRQFLVSIAAMLGILIPLSVIYLLMQVNDRRMFARSQRPARHERWLVDVPLSVYLAWISVATIVNVASALDAQNWSGWGISVTAWTVIMLGVGATIAAVMALRWCDAAFVLVFVWAYVAIAVRQFEQTEQKTIALTAVALAIGMMGLLAVAVRKPPLARS
jgi:hypothetical protein